MVKLTFTLIMKKPATATIDPSCYYDVAVKGQPLISNFRFVGSELPKEKYLPVGHPLFREVVFCWLLRAIPGFMKQPRSDEPTLQLAMELLERNSPEEVLNLLRLLN